MMDESILEDLGLTHAEIKVYLALLELGSASAGPILEKSGLHNSVVHRNLDRLIEKGLITFVLEGKKKYYQAVDPKSLIDFLEEKKERVKSILPELIEKQRSAKQKPEARIYRGVRGVKELLYQMIDTDAKEYFGYGGPQKAHDLLGDHFWAGFHNRRIQRKISAKLIFHSSLKWWGEKLNRKRLTNVRFTSRDFEALTETVICGSNVGIIVYLDKPYGFLLQEKIAANSYKKFFDLLWNTGQF